MMLFVARSISALLGYSSKHLDRLTLYDLAHPEDLFQIRRCHRKRRPMTFAHHNNHTQNTLDNKEKNVYFVDPIVLPFGPIKIYETIEGCVS